VKQSVVLGVMLFGWMLQAVEPEPIGLMRNSILKMTEYLQSHKEWIFSELYSQTGDTSNDLLFLTSNNLVKIYYFDKNRIMEKELTFEQLPMPYQVIHRHLLEADRHPENKIYLSDFFPEKGRTCYLHAVKYGDRIAIILQTLYFPETPDRYAVFNYQGDLLHNTLDVPLDIKNYISTLKESQGTEIISGRFKIYRFKFFKNYSIYYLFILNEKR
jgi:hypothetical protein